MNQLSHSGVLQIEPTDFCNLRCRMCTPQHSARENVHGDLPKGFMDIGLFRKIIDDVAGSSLSFDHLIFQWLGEPLLHPGLPDMLEYAHQRVRDRFRYFRIDTNAVPLTSDRVDRLVEIYRQDPAFPILLVFSLDAESPATYRRVKEAPEGTLPRVLAHIDYLLERRAELEATNVNLNCEFQFVLQPGNAHELKAFIEYWDQHLAQGSFGRGYNKIMIKRLSVAAGGPGQRQVDELYDEAIRVFRIRAFRKPHIHLEIWEERTWERDVAPAPDSGKPR